MKTLPTNYLAITAEFARQEYGGKLSLLGVFADGQLRVPHGTPFPINLPLAAYFSFSDGEGEFDAVLALRTKGGDRLFFRQPIEKQVKYLGVPLVVTINVALFTIPELGDYEFVVTLDEREYVRSLNVAFAVEP